MSEVTPPDEIAKGSNGPVRTVRLRLQLWGDKARLSESLSVLTGKSEAELVHDAYTYFLQMHRAGIINDRRDPSRQLLEAFQSFDVIERRQQIILAEGGRLIVQQSAMLSALITLAPAVQRGRDELETTTGP